MCAKSLIRSRQRSLTAVFPHQGNDKFAIPNRRMGTPIDPVSETGDEPLGGSCFRITGPGDAAQVNYEAPEGSRLRVITTISEVSDGGPSGEPWPPADDELIYYKVSATNRRYETYYDVSETGTAFNKLEVPMDAEVDASCVVCFECRRLS